MKFLKTNILFATVSLFVFACQKDDYGAVRGKGDIITENRALTGFDAIHLKNSADVSFTQDSVYKVEVFAQDNVINVLKLEVIDKELMIDYSKLVISCKQVKVVVHSPRIRSLKISGSGNITGTGTIKTDQLLTHISGSGNIRIPCLIADAAEAKINGSGDTEFLSGETNSASYSISGSGDIRSESMKTSINVSKISGSGDIRLHATERLTVSISGSGDIHYRGTPGMDVDIKGSGKIRKI